MNTPGK